MMRRHGPKKLDTFHFCLSCNFWASEDQIKNISSRYLVSRVDVIRDTINCQKESFHQFFNGHIFCNFFQKAQFWEISKQQIIEKYATMGYIPNTFAIHRYMPRLNWLHLIFDSQVITCSKKKESWFYFHWFRSYSSNKVKNAYYITIYDVTSFNAMQKMWWFLAS